MNLSYRLRLFISLSAIAALALAIAALLTARTLTRETASRIERSLVSEVKLAAELLAHSLRDTPVEALDREADRLGRIVEARVTFIAADGTVIGDSAEDAASLAALENHAGRPEVVSARDTGLGISRRYSTTVQTDLLYVAVPTQHPSIAVVRLALPLNEIRAQIRVVSRATGLALVIALGFALALAWFASSLLAARLQAVAAAAQRYAAGDPSPQAGANGDDEIGQLGRVLHESFRELASRMTEIERSRGRLAAILSGMVEGVMVVDDQGRVQLVNDSAREMLLMPRQSGQGAAAGEHYLHLIRHPDIVAQFTSAIGGRQPDAAEIVLSGGRVAVARAVPLARGGAVLVLHDITRLRHADQVRRDFVANVSHELRTPLTSIRGYAEALRDDSPGPEDRERFLEIIGRHTVRMTRLVDDLLRLARVEAAEEPIDRARCDIAALFESTEADLRPRLDAKGQRIVMEVGPGAEQLITDAAALEEILKNLVENAINYAPDSTEIRLTAVRRESHCELQVADQGPGIPPADLTRVFERFYRVDKARARESGGTGLGLAIVKHLANRLGGSVRVDNRREGGACFTVILPCAEAPPPSANEVETQI